MKGISHISTARMETIRVRVMEKVAWRKRATRSLIKSIYIKSTKPLTPNFIKGRKPQQVSVSV